MIDVSPTSRDELLLQAILGEGLADFEPQSRIEALLKRIVEEGGIGGGSTKILGSYDTLAELEAAHPTGSAGDAYLVGSPSHLYVWLVDDLTWHDSGAFSAVAGEDGVGIASIEKTSTEGLVDTYTITYTDGDTDTFTVTNGEQGDDGVGITSIEKTATVGLVDTYTITLSDGSTYTFTVTNGSGSVPDGGKTGQVLAKKSDTDGDVEWVDQTGGSDYESEIASLTSENSQQTSEIGSLSTENSTQTSEIGSLSVSMSELASAAASQSAAQSEIDSTQTSEIGSLSTENSTQTSEISSLASETSAQTSEIASLTSENSTQTSEIGSLSTENSTQTSEIGSLSVSMSELASTAASTSAAQSEIDSTQTSEIGSLSQASSELASEVTVIGSEVATKQDELTEGPGIDISEDNTISTEVNIFTGTTAEWNALTDDEKKTYTHCALTDDEGTGVVDEAPTEDSLNLVTSGGVYAAEALKQNITDNTLETTDKTIPGAINELNTDLTWKLAGSSSGGQSFDITSLEYTELLVTIYSTTASSQVFEFTLNNLMTLTGGYLSNGFYIEGTGFVAVRIQYNSTEIIPSVVNVDGTSQVNNCVLTVYYR